MLSTLNNIGRGQAELTIELAVEELKPYLQKAATNISQATKIPGFRPGTAPYEVVKVNVGEMTIYQEASHLAIRKTLFDAVKEKKLSLIGEPQVDVVKLAPDNPFIYKATLNLLPEIKIGDWQKIKIKKGEIKVTDEDVAKVLKNFQEVFASEVLVEKSAKDNDRVEIDFEVSLDKVMIDGGNQKKYPLVIGQKQMMPGFEEQLIGLKKAEEKTFQLKFPADYQNKLVAGKLADFKVKMLSVYERTLPEINDELVKKINPEQTLNEFKEKIKEDLLKDKENKEGKRLEQEMLEQLIKLSEFGEVPEILINNETDKMIEELKQSVEMNGLAFDQYLQSINKTLNDLKLEFTTQAIIRIKSSLILEQLSLEKNLIASATEVEDEINHLLNHHNLTAEQKSAVKSHQYKHYLETLLNQQKALEWLKKEVVK